MDFKDGVTFVDDTKIKLGYPVGNLLCPFSLFLIIYLGKYFAVRTVDKADTTYIKVFSFTRRILFFS